MQIWKGAFCAAFLVATPALGQDLNTLDRHLEHQQWKRMQDHQNRMRSGDAKRNKPIGSATGKGACSADALPLAKRRALESEYVQRTKSDGTASADAWVRKEGMRFRQTLKAKGIC